MRLIRLLILFAVSLTLFSCQSVKQRGEVFDQKSYFGEKITYPHAISPNLKLMKIDVNFPDGYGMIETAQPYVKLINPDGSLIVDKLINEFPVQVPITKKIQSPQIFADFSLFYCREKELAMCLKKNILYEVMVDDSSKQDALDLTYTVKDL